MTIEATSTDRDRLVALIEKYTGPFYGSGDLADAIIAMAGSEES
jgi:hypothetical protein